MYLLQTQSFYNITMKFLTTILAQAALAILASALPSAEPSSPPVEVFLTTTNFNGAMERILVTYVNSIGTPSVGPVRAGRSKGLQKRLTNWWNGKVNNYGTDTLVVAFKNWVGSYGRDFPSDGTARILVFSQFIA